MDDLNYNFANSKPTLLLKLLEIPETFALSYQPAFCKNA